MSHIKRNPPYYTTHIPHNYNLLNEADHSRIVEAIDEKIEKEDIGFEVIDLTQLTKKKEESDDDFTQLSKKKEELEMMMRMIYHYPLYCVVHSDSD
ncbi:hypothetical protein QE152_g25902 [Popillia japonica]|uniref:Uncharacterized protein n=1 Tax=Popillia japonica TaxID=7064 RepID=A0AAW1JYW7_POPJA